jgi:hypothetical protein
MRLVPGHPGHEIVLIPGMIMRIEYPALETLAAQIPAYTAKAQ